MRKVVFLDIDGVLNSGKYITQCPDFDDPAQQLDPAAIARLNIITDMAGAVIVVSSTWRLAFHGDLEKLQDCMKSYHIKAPVIGMTPNKPNAVRNRRGKEIQKWIDDHHEIDKFVIIDDDSDMGKLGQYQIKTLFEDGLQDQHIAQAVVRLQHTKCLECEKAFIPDMASPTDFFTGVCFPCREGFGWWECLVCNNMCIPSTWAEEKACPWCQDHPVETPIESRIDNKP